MTQAAQRREEIRVELGIERATLTVAEISALLDTSESEVYRMAKAGIIPCKRTGLKGGRYLFPTKLFNDWLHTPDNTN